jgi:hypothetical protein
MLAASRKEVCPPRLAASEPAALSSLETDPDGRYSASSRESRSDRMVSTAEVPLFSPIRNSGELAIKLPSRSQTVGRVPKNPKATRTDGTSDD